jgi:hypothetical protein
MRKRITTLQSFPASDQAWLDLEHLALVEVTSEEVGYPIESALSGEENRGWRAAYPGTQTIRVLFDEPQSLQYIRLAFEDTETTRTQEFVLRWSPGIDSSFREIIRQQWNFSSPDSVREVENYSVELRDVAVLELVIEPDKGHVGARASILSLRVGSRRVRPVR